MCSLADMRRPTHSDQPPAYSRSDDSTALASAGIHDLDQIESLLNRARSASLIPPDEENPPDIADEALPPKYTPLNESLHLFSIQGSIIHGIPRNSSGSLPVARYQLGYESTRSGRPCQLKIRRLLASESRSALRGVEFDDDLILYLLENLAAKLPFGRGIGAIEIRGRQAGTLSGCIQLPSENLRASVTKSLGGSRRFWHITKNAAGDALREENAAKIQKYGYRPSDEQNKNLLYSVRKSPKSKTTEWRGREGQLVAIETATAALEIIGNVDRRTRDLIVTCWCAEMWAKGSLPWNPENRRSLSELNGA
jgi:hypothetical protein